MEPILRIETITELHKLLEYQKPKHPLISFIPLDQVSFKVYEDAKIVYGFYSISFKTGQQCEITYGRRRYDFDEGTLVFLGPEKVVSYQKIADPTPAPPTPDSWMLCFHPDLIRGTDLGSKMDQFPFFDYNANEALHLSDEEKKIINNIIQNIHREYSINLDVYSNKLLISNLEVLLNYADRFYGRQFITRQVENNDVITRFDHALKARMTIETLEEKGMPTIAEFAQQMGYSSHYLSDMLKKETGKTTKEHIHFQVVEQAKNLLLGTNKTVAEIAQILGFEQPAYFSRLFKQKTGLSPINYRN